MSIFNSLGSNYDFGFVLETFFATNKESSSLRLKIFLEEKYEGNAVLVYKGREALRLALRVITPSLDRGAIAPKGKTVGICGFTCYAVYEAIMKEGYDVEYLDIDESLNFSYDTLKKALQKISNLKVLLIQNTLGYPGDIEKIAKLCQEKGIILIEDLAHCIGTKYADGKEAGTIGDFVILSFSQDKMIDGISGGALVVRTLEMRSEKLEVNFEALDLKKQYNDRLYPLFTFLIRKTYALGIGKVLHWFLKKKKWLQSPMDNQGSENIHEMPDWQAYLIYQGYKELEENLAHRRKIATIYEEGLNKITLEKSIVKNVLLSANLRFPIFVEKRGELISYLKQKNIYISDIWYDAPIGPKKYLSKTDYTAQCPNSEKIVGSIVNLPTHRNVSEVQAKFIVRSINEWVESSR